MELSGATLPATTHHSAVSNLEEITTPENEALRARLHRKDAAWEVLVRACTSAVHACLPAAPRSQAVAMAGMPSTSVTISSPNEKSADATQTAAPSSSGSTPIVPVRRYFEAESLIASVDSGAMALLRGQWLVALHRRGGIIARRQDLPAEAFWSAVELKELAKTLGADFGVLLVALSYRWLSAAHPDPEGFHLAIVAQVAALYLKPDAERSPLAAAFKRAGLCEVDVDFGLLWDFGSLHQNPRTDEQTALFKQGLGDLPMWYGHAETTTWMQPDLPTGFGERMLALGLAETYDDSGW